MSMYPAIEPYEHGMLEVGDDNGVYWETCGNPQGKPALVIHGGPGSGCTPWHRRLFHPTKYRVVLFDQRGCGRSTPHASEITTSLASNTTANLINDIERLREHLGIDQWLLLGGSWGSALAIAYAEAHPVRVSAMVMWGVSTGRYMEFDWLFRGGVSVLFPEQWQRMRAALPERERDADIVAAYYRRLNDSEVAVREQAALAWCTWESATPNWPPSNELSPRFRDPRFRMAFARVVTHYVNHYAWLEDGILLREIPKLAKIPAVLISGRFDFQSPLKWAWDLSRAWPSSRLIVVDDAGHDASNAGITAELIRATDQFA